MGFRSVVFNMVARIYYTVLLIFFFSESCLQTLACRYVATVYYTYS